MYSYLNSSFGLELTSSQLTLSHLLMRTFLIYLGGMFLFRLHRQVLRMNTPFNYMVNFIIGSLAANAIVGEGNYFSIVGTCLFVIACNWFIAVLCYFVPFFETIFKGSGEIVVQNGTIHEKKMRKHLITHDELLEGIRENIHTEELSRVKKAFFENDGEITVVVEKK